MKERPILTNGPTLQFAKGGSLEPAGMRHGVEKLRADTIEADQFPPDLVPTTYLRPVA